MPNNWESRRKRVEFLVNHYNELGLQNYPWGLSRLNPAESLERFNRENKIYLLFIQNNLLSPKTNQRDVNFNNLINDARKELYKQYASKVKSDLY